MRAGSIVLALLVAAAAAISSAAAYPGPCVSSVVSGADLDSDDDRVAKDDDFLLCLVFNGATQGVFNAKVDHFTQIVVQGSSQIVPAGTGYYGVSEDVVTWSAEQPDTTSYITVLPQVLNTTAQVQKIYKFIEPQGLVNQVPIMTIIIHAEDGEVKYITYDEGCYFCDPEGDECVENSFSPSRGIIQSEDYMSCLKKDADCAANPSDCDLKVYVTWSGTDVNGAFFRSAGSRFSRFRSFGVESLYNSALQDAEFAAQKGAKIADNVQNINF